MPGSEDPLQEFYCTKSGGGCGGYIMFPLNNQVNGVVEVVCPNCGHKHQRTVKNGVLGDDGRFDSNPIQQICPPKPAWSKVARHPDSKKAADDWAKERKATIIEEDFLRDRKFELWGAP